jgi:hypothetical protein
MQIVCLMDFGLELSANPVQHFTKKTILFHVYSTVKIAIGGKSRFFGECMLYPNSFYLVPICTR